MEFASGEIPHSLPLDIAPPPIATGIPADALTEAPVSAPLAFWFPDEVVLYSGLAGKRMSRPVRGEVSKRVADYYNTALGARMRAS